MKKESKTILSIISITLFLILAFGSDSEDNTVYLNAAVQFTGTQFVITNLDTFDYVNAKIEVNNEYFIDGYTLESGKTYSVGMSQFADDDGNRFTMLQKSQFFGIFCDLDNDKSGFYYSKWK